MRGARRQVGCRPKSTSALRTRVVCPWTLQNRGSQFVNGLGDAIRGTRRGFHSPVQVVCVRADEVNPAVRFDEDRPEFCELSGAIGRSLTGGGPRVESPNHGVRLLDVLGPTGILLLVSSESPLSGPGARRRARQQATRGLHFLRRAPR